MKKFLLTLLVLSSTLLALSQGTWKPRDTLPTDSAMGQGITGISIGNYGYAGLGNYSGASITFNKFWQFDPSIDAWTRKADFPGSARVTPASFVIGKYAYLVTGSVNNFGACVIQNWQYNSITDIWTRKANFPSTPRVYAVGFAIGGKGYVGTGANEVSDFRKDFYAYDTATDTWTRIADFPGIARDAACGFAVNGKGYVCFGQDSTFKAYNDIWEYDTGANSWTQKANCPYPMIEASGFVICSNIYVGSGDSTAALDGFHEFWKYNTTLDLWTQVTSVPGVKKLAGAAFAIGDTGYYGFGFDSVVSVHNVFDRFYAGDSCNSITTSYSTFSDVSDIGIYPNPNNGIFTISFNHPELVSMPKTTIEIYNVLGERVYSEILKQVQYDINLKKEPSGVYILLINQSNRNLTKKIIINH